MRMRTLRVLLTGARLIQRVLDVRVPMDAVYGLRTR
jgi:hypothetical protein